MCVTCSKMDYCGYTKDEKHERDGCDESPGSGKRFTFTQFNPFPPKSRKTGMLNS